MKRNGEERFGAYYLFVWMFLFLWVFCFSQAHAESLDLLAEGADSVVVAVPVREASFWQGGLIKTRVLLKIGQMVVGERVKREISVLYDGGIVGTIGLRVSHGVCLPRGQKAVLFLVDKGNYFSVYHGGEGVFYVRSFSGKEVVIPAREAVSRPGRFIRSLKEEEEGVPLETFLSEIRRLRGARP